MWLTERRIVIPGPRRLADFAREAFDATEASMAATIEAGIGKAAVLKAIDWCYAPQPGIAGSRLERLKTPPKRHSPSTMAETLEKVRALKELGVHGGPLDSVALSKQQAYAAHVQMRRPSMTARIEQQRQTVEITRFLRVTLLELTDMALLQASRRSQALFRRAAERVEKGRSRSGGVMLQQALKAKSVLHDESKPWRDRVLEARALLDDIGEAGASTFASQVRRALAEDNRRVHAHLAGLRDIEFAGEAGDPGHDQWQAWQRLQAHGAKEIPQDFELPPVGAAWNTIVSDLDPQSRYRAFEASTMMALRKSLRRGSAWGLFYDQPIVLNERQAGVAVEGVEQHTRAEDRIRVSLLAVDTHGVTNVAMAIAKLLGFDLCPRLRDLRERKLFVPRGWPVPESLEGVTVRRVSIKAIEHGWDDLVRLAASIRAGKVSAAHAIHRLGSAAIGDPLHRAAEHLVRLLRTLFLCDYLAIPDYRREIHTLLNRGESVHQLQRAIHGGQMAPERGRRRQEMAAISGAHVLLTNIVLAWNTNRMDSVVARLNRDGNGIEEDWLRRIGPAHFSHINFRGTFRFNVERYADVLVERAVGRGAAKPGQ
jgi:TnpA family transposase